MHSRAHRLASLVVAIAPRLASAEVRARMPATIDSTRGEPTMRRRRAVQARTPEDLQARLRVRRRHARASAPTSRESALLRAASEDAP